MKWKEQFSNFLLLALFFSARPYHDSPVDFRGGTLAYTAAFHKQLVEDAAGNTYSLTAVLDRPRPTLIKFWASWCASCNHSMPNITEVQERNQRNDPVATLISIDSDRVAWLQAVDRHQAIPGTHYRLVGAMNPELREKLQFSEIPRYLVVDRYAILRRRLSDPREPAVLTLLQSSAGQAQ